MSNVVKFPGSARSIPEGTDPITSLRRAIRDCINARGEKTTALVISQAFEIANTFNWRQRTRELLDGGKSNV